MSINGRLAASKEGAGDHSELQSVGNMIIS